MLEKRKSIRRFAAMNIACFSPDGNSAADKCVLVNISKGGVGIESRKNFKTGERLKIIFNSPKGEEVSVLAEILYSLDGSFASFYGARYCDSDGAKRLILNKYLLKYFNLY
ncbi:MAG: PilZ domain-containing protein [Endomicrobium sp.]|jgi:hypothetical protein|nr:PilZ domain-containing protein [Endomicrobium sp.]